MKQSGRKDVENANHSKLGRRISIWHEKVVTNTNLGNDFIIHALKVEGKIAEWEKFMQMVSDDSFFIKMIP